MALHFVDAAAGAAGPGDRITLTGAEAHHAAAVRRVRVGEIVTLGDGRGAWLTGACASVSPREVVIEVTERTEVPAPAMRVGLVQALAKGDRDELAVQAATELGVDEVMPWQATRSVSRWDAGKAEKGRARWGTIAREAAKQAHRAWLPEVTELVTTRQLASRAATARMLVLEPTASVALTAWRPAADDAEVLLVVGPEGGIAPEELRVLADAGATLVRLGDTVLRTSTAGPAALALVNATIGRW
ncbi:16S rRNA (uracil(1498)-N(3))-methyltransferase [Microbacterium sp. zg.Y1090]|uniref:16S rRNA (uracil(1498)-N(3))-methyltransferase n=1 Tax=Microbacterium TaxID=33882 RepID=UPI00214B6828|nr:MULTISPECIES: 16S rRNA (uracil(1498)-N(3))-methyltransferase [unclassified Microbacterium]MCR2811775.1 16S rRNA (uracil(1498)-N(3))-methyltransferase [Microbacterium sp. zg.Y1084]MCR2818787.1 16S rRNA (uracil(1498)-N(3))-methyltransferase [Microbacterium sp. zg.Y1090]MDL5486877.1 16S rRNA (uracil(1498)-N(3))-methyltransferase [Microbacterium sp. zg-Y1211]WIM27102.1 16S rRNA (uracil(1498)-N(3))-methyltransferase [Microbacterium sp. zg-Y1090]